MFNYLATLRLHDGGALVVGPKRRVVFPSGVTQDKRAVKAALAPLAGYWSKHETDGPPPQPNVPTLSYLKFRQSAKVLLTDAGLLKGNHEA